MYECGFFNSVNGDRKYNAEQIGEYLGLFVSDGVFPNPSTNLQVRSTGGMNIAISPGKGWAQEHWIKNKSDWLMELPQSNMVYARIDAIMMVLDLSQPVRNFYFEIKSGVPAADPVRPDMVRREDRYEYCLATVKVKANVNEITQADITDTRADTTICGWVTGLIDQVDTAELFNQWQDAYEREYARQQQLINDNTALFYTWFDAVKDTLLAKATIVRNYVSTYKTTADNTAEIPIGIAQYDKNWDVLEVYVNGFKLTAAEYTINDNTKITLTKPVRAGQEVSFQVLKSLEK